MHYVSDRSMMRNGYCYQEVPGGGWVGYPPDWATMTTAPSWMRRLIFRLKSLFGS